MFVCVCVYLMKVWEAAQAAINVDYFTERRTLDPDTRAAPSVWLHLNGCHSFQAPECKCQRIRPCSATAHALLLSRPFHLLESSSSPVLPRSYHLHFICLVRLSSFRYLDDLRVALRGRPCPRVRPWHFSVVVS